MKAVVSGDTKTDATADSTIGNTAAITADGDIDGAAADTVDS